MVHFLIITLIISYLIFFKYFIDKELTIKELKKDVYKYRTLFFQKLEKEGRNEIIENNMYTIIKTNINRLIQDLSNTNFESYNNIKKEIIFALEDIESYGMPRDRQ